jgi:hypothetical protein
MARFNPQKLRKVYVDGEPTPVAEMARIIDIVDNDVTSIQAFNPTTGKNELITREQFERDVPEGFSTNLTAIDKG